METPGQAKRQRILEAAHQAWKDAHQFGQKRAYFQVDNEVWSITHKQRVLHFEGYR